MTDMAVNLLSTVLQIYSAIISAKKRCPETKGATIFLVRYSAK